jgi:hypothetical protein
MLPEIVQHQVDLFKRELWKTTMHAAPKYGSAWSIYHKLGDFLAYGHLKRDRWLYKHFYKEATTLAFQPALDLCVQHLTGQHALRKRALTLLRIADMHWR